MDLPSQGGVTVDVLRPAFLLLLLTIPWAWQSARRARPPVSRALLARRSAMLALLTFALSGLTIRTGAGTRAVIYVVDRSDSVPAAAQQAALEAATELTAEARRGDVAGLVVFGLDAAIARRPAEGARFTDLTSVVAGSGTNIAGALRLARLAMPVADNRHILLISDGRETAGSAADEAALAAADGIRIDALAPRGLEHRDQRPARVVAVSAPATVAADEMFAVSIAVEGTPLRDGQVAVAMPDGKSIVTDVTFSEEGEGAFSFLDSQGAPGSYTYRAAIGNTASDADAEQGAVVTVAGRTRVLYVAHAPTPLQSLLAAAGYDVDRAATRSIPPSRRELDSYDAVVLDDVSPDELTAAQLSALEQYVEHSGGGVIVLGRGDTFAGGGYIEGPMARMIPVDLRARAGKREPSAAIVLAFDKSGSMAGAADGVSKIEAARQSVLKVLDAVPPADLLGVIAFDTAVSEILPFGTARDTPAVRRRLDELAPNGPTALAPALEIADAWLRSTNVSRKHVLLLSDGRTPPGDAERARDIVRNGGFQLSIVAVGGDADRPFLERLAASTGGRAHFPDDLTRLPLLVGREAAAASGGSRNDETFTLRTASHPIVALTETGAPRMSGYAVGAPKPGAEVVLASHLEDPILAGWRFGLGKVAMFTGDLGSASTTELRRWPNYGALWAQCLRWVARPAASAGLRADLVDRSGLPVLVAEADRQDGTFVNPSEVIATIRHPDGRTNSVPLVPTAPGRFETAIEGARPGPYSVHLAAREATGESELRLLRGFYWSPATERSLGANVTALEAIARAGGGRLRKPGDSPFLDTRHRRRTDLSGVLALAAFFLFLVDAALRRRGLRWRPSAAAGLRSH